MICICNFHVLSHLLLIYICKLHWNSLMDLLVIFGPGSADFRFDTLCDDEDITVGSLGVEDDNQPQAEQQTHTPRADTHRLCSSLLMQLLSRFLVSEAILPLLRRSDGKIAYVISYVNNKNIIKIYEFHM